MKRMTDERLAECEDEIYLGIVPKTPTTELELLQALKAERERIAQLEADLYEGNCELEKQQRINSELEAGWDKHVDMWKAERERNHDLQARLAESDGNFN